MQKKYNLFGKFVLISQLIITSLILGTYPTLLKAGTCYAKFTTNITFRDKWSSDFTNPGCDPNVECVPKTPTTNAIGMYSGWTDFQTCADCEDYVYKNGGEFKGCATYEGNKITSTQDPPQAICILTNKPNVTQFFTGPKTCKECKDFAYQEGWPFVACGFPRAASVKNKAVQTKSTQISQKSMPAKQTSQLKKK